MKDLVLLCLGGIALLVGMLFLSATFRVTDTKIDRIVITNSQGYNDGQVDALMKAYNEYTRLAVAQNESQWCQDPECNRVELIEGYRLAKNAQFENMKRIVATLPTADVPDEVNDLLLGR